MRVSIAALRRWFAGLTLCFFFLIVLQPAVLLAQCATCRAGGHCAQNQGGKCLANRTFWGYYQGNWRKWPTVAAAEHAAEAEAAHTQSPAAAAPSVVLPKSIDEAREGNVTPGSSAGSAANSSSDAGGEKTDTTDPTGETSSSRIPPNEAQAPLDNALLDSAKPVPPNSPAARPKLPGTALDDPAPIPPVDPNDSVPNLPPNLQDLKPPVEETPNLEDIFQPKPETAPAPKPAGGAELPPANAPAEVALTPAERTAAHLKRVREHAARNREYMAQRYKDAVVKPRGRMTVEKNAAAENVAAQEELPADHNANAQAVAADVAASAAAAANEPSTAGSLDEPSLLRRTDVADQKLPTRSVPAETKEPQAAEPVSAEPTTPAPQEPPAAPADGLPEPQTPAADATDEQPPLEIDEPSLLLSPTDTAEAQNPLRENVAHARYAARMFTPQLRETATPHAAHAAGGRRNAPNPLRAGASASAISPANALRDVVTVSYEEELPSSNKAAEPTLPVSELPAELSPPPFEQAAPTVEAPAESVLQSDAAEPKREESAAPMTLERKSPIDAAASNNVLRDVPNRANQQSFDNPLRNGADPSEIHSASPSGGKSLPARSPGAGHYRASLATPAPVASTASPATKAISPQPRPQLSTSRPQASQNALGSANPLR